MMEDDDRDEGAGFLVVVALILSIGGCLCWSWRAGAVAMLIWAVLLLAASLYETMNKDAGKE